MHIDMPQTWIHGPVLGIPHERFFVVPVPTRTRRSHYTKYYVLFCAHINSSPEPAPWSQDRLEQHITLPSIE